MSSTSAAAAARASVRPAPPGRTPPDAGTRRARTARSAARAPGHGPAGPPRGAVGLALDQREGLEHRVVQVRRDLRPLGLPDALAALLTEVADQPHPPRHGDHRGADERGEHGEQPELHLTHVEVPQQEDRDAGGDEQRPGDHPQQRRPPPRARARPPIGGAGPRRPPATRPQHRRSRRPAARRPSPGSSCPARRRRARRPARARRARAPAGARGRAPAARRWPPPAGRRSTAVRRRAPRRR